MPKLSGRKIIITVFTLHTVKMRLFNSIAYNNKNEFYEVHRRKILKFSYFLCIFFAFTFWLGVGYRLSLWCCHQRPPMLLPPVVMGICYYYYYYYYIIIVVNKHEGPVSHGHFKGLLEHGGLALALYPKCCEKLFSASWIHTKHGQVPHAQINLKCPSPSAHAASEVRGPGWETWALI